MIICYVCELCSSVCIYLERSPSPLPIIDPQLEVIVADHIGQSITYQLYTNFYTIQNAAVITICKRLF